MSVSRLAATSLNIGHLVAPKTTLKVDDYLRKRQPTQLRMAELPLSSADKRFRTLVHVAGHAHRRDKVAAQSDERRVAKVAKRLALNCLVSLTRGICRSRSEWQLSVASAGNVRFEF